MSHTRLNIDLYKKVFLIRKAEEKIQQLYPEDEMKTPTHLSIGEEAIMAGACQALSPSDQVFGTYRSHGLYLARTLETDQFYAELYGKESGLAKGKTGSMHLHAIEKGFLGSSAVVATTIPVANGAAFANKVKKNGKIVSVFFGDGAIEEGAFWESLNIACLKELSVVYVCEDNALAINTHKSQRQSFNSICDIAAQFKCNVFQENSTDPEVIYTLMSAAIDKAKTTRQPSFVYLQYYRYLEHVGVYPDFDAGYRPKTEFEDWYKRDPVILQRAKLLSLGVTEAEVLKIENKILHQIDQSIVLAKESNFPEESELESDVLA